MRLKEPSPVASPRLLAPEPSGWIRPRVRPGFLIVVQCGKNDGQNKLRDGRRHDDRDWFGPGGIRGLVMTTRIIVNHDDPTFVEALAAALRAKGCDVVTGADPAETARTPRIAGILELTISQARTRYRGVRIRVTGLPGNSDYAGALGHFLKVPVAVADVVKALEMFNV